MQKNMLSVMCFCKKNYSGVPLMLPIPCACNEPSQHFLLYVLPSGHKQPLLLYFGEVLLGVLNFLLFILFVFW